VHKHNVKNVELERMGLN